MKFYFERRVLIGFFCTIFVLITLCLLAFLSTQQLLRTPGFESTEFSVISLRQFQFSCIGLTLAVILIIIYLFYLTNKTLKERNLADEKLRHIVSTTRQDFEAEMKDKSQKLQEIDYVYRSLAANIPGTAITILDRDERYLLAEGDLLPKMGYTKADMPGKKISEIITPENYEYYEGIIRRVFAGETILVERQTLSGYYTLMKVVPLRRNSDEIFAIMFVLIDVTEIKKVQVELAELNNVLEAKVSDRTSQLKKVNEELEAFTYYVSHDLRTPLRAISGLARILTEDYSVGLGDEGMRICNSINLSAERMSKLIDDLLSFSHLSKAELSKARIDMNSLVGEVLTELTFPKKSKKINIKTLPLEPAAGDINLMRQVWINLISNAVKYSSKKEIANIEIGNYKENDDIIYYIADNGAGFDMKFVDKLFGVFERLHSAKEFEGTGVGLALVNNVIQKHGGKIWAESKPNEGAKFYFTIPTK